MKYSITFICICLLFFSCDSENESEPTNAIYWEGACCSNIELLDGEKVFSDIVGYSESILAAVNIQEFEDLNLTQGDSLFIDYVFSDGGIICKSICDNYNGIPIELKSIVKK